MQDLLEASMSSDPNDWPIFSYSQTQSWDRCELLWHFQYVEKWTPKAQETFLGLGSEIHQANALWYQMIQAGYKFDDRMKNMETYFRGRVNEYAMKQEFLPVVSRCMTLMMKYFTEWSPQQDLGHKVLAVEHHFTTPFKTGKGRNYILQGYIDLMTLYRNKIFVWDHKSMENKFWTPDEVKMEPQGPLYLASLREQGEKVHGMIINMFNTYDYKKGQSDVTKLFHRESDYKSDKQLNVIVQEVGFIIDDIIENYTTPRRSMRRDCGKCKFREPCFMMMKGIDPAPFLMSSFKKKDGVDVELKLQPERLQHA
jgi:hypothetical protein